jgi:hypothetical protein
MRGKAAVIDGPARIPGHLNLIAAAGVRKQHEARYSAQQQLRNLIALWSGWQLSLGRDDSQSYRIFYHTFGIDVLSAQALGRPEAENLAAKIQQLLDKNQVVPL